MNTKIVRPSLEDPARNATRQQKAAAFEWLRTQSLVEPLGDGPAFHAAVLLYQVGELLDLARGNA
jgi:hypothetical protein